MDVNPRWHHLGNIHEKAHCFGKAGVSGAKYKLLKEEFGFISSGRKDITIKLNTTD